MIVAELKTQDAPKVTPVFQNILVAIDFSEASRRALCSALRWAEEHHAHISVVHVSNADWRYEMLENPPEIDLEEIDVEQQVKALVQNVGSKQRIDAFLVKHGPVTEAILSAITDQETDLLVIGTRGRGGLQKLALGSVAEEVLRSSPCPVMTIGPHASIAGTERGPGFHTILFATDFGKGSAKALPLVLALAREHQAKVILVHMIPPMPATSTSLSAYAPPTAAADELQEWEESSRNRSLQQLREWLPREPGLKQEPEFVVGTDFLPEGVLTATANFNADLIVMGATHKGSARVAAHIPWSAVHEVVRNAPCPVLTVAA